MSAVPPASFRVSRGELASRLCHLFSAHPSRYTRVEALVSILQHRGVIIGKSDATEPKIFRPQQNLGESKVK